ncbi:MAG TPA: hypothetical protein VF183_14315 [Acidimicrobiales bacterium]
MAEIIKYADAKWEIPDGIEPDEQGRALRRAGLLRGAAGFFSHVIECPPHTVLPPHSHDHEELIMVLGGSATIGDTVLEPFDVVAIDANEVYGITAGDYGLTFLVVRRGAASLEVR